MKAVLKGQDGSFFTLAPKVTTIGREGCDINIQIQGIDYQHAVVEYCEPEDCLILQDLNSAQGTYVNDVRVQNAAVRLAPGDRIRFGYTGMPYELHMEQQSAGVICPPVQQQQRQAWSGSLTILNESPTYASSHSQQQQQQQQQQFYPQGILTTPQGLPIIPPGMAAGQQGLWALPATTPPTQAPLPRPPLRSRPLSAGSARRSTFDAPRIPPPPATTIVGAPVSRQGPVGGWVNGVTQVTQRGTTGPSAALDLAQQQAQEKEFRISQLSEEVSRLRSFEFESLRKDQLIEQLQQQIDDQQKKMNQQPSIIMGSGDTDNSERLAEMEAEISSRKAEVAALKEQLAQMQLHSQGGGSPSMLRQELGERVKEITLLRTELERVKRDKMATTGLVTQIQQGMTSKFEEENTINRLSREIEVLKKDLRDRDKLLADANLKVNKIREASSSTKIGEERDAREKELISLRQRFKGAESKISEQFNTISSLNEEMDALKTSLQEVTEARTQLQTEVDTHHAQFLDTQKSEQAVKAELEQTVKMLEELRKRITDTTFATLEGKPEGELSDDEVLDMLKKLLEERITLSGKLKEMRQEVEQEMEQVTSSMEAMKAEGEKLCAALQECVNQVKEKGRGSTSLTQAVDQVQSLAADTVLVWVRDLVADVFISELQWQDCIEKALEKCGVDCKDSSEAPGQHIEQLFVQWESLLSEKQQLETQIAEAERQHEDDIQQRLDALQKELEDKLVTAVENARLEEEEKAGQAMKIMRAAEEEKLGIAVSEEKQRAAELEACVQDLRQAMAEQQSEHQSNLEQTSTLESELENYRLLEADLKAQLQQLEERLATETGGLREEREEAERRKEEEVGGLEEQVRQHSVTICSLEERLTELNKRIKSYVEEISSLRNVNEEMRVEMERLQSQKPAVPPKPKVIIQRPTEEISALEEMVGLLRAENVELKKSVTEQQDVIMGLRRDLAGASARLSDITGEMSESQKREMEQNRELLTRRDKEIVELRQQMAKLSKIIDKQKTDVTSLKEDLNKEKSVVMKYRTELDDRDGRLLELESRLKDEKEEQKRQLELLDQEGRITSELVGIGAQCRGERHDQIIMRQREALAELRSRVKVLEQSRAPLPSPDQALQQVVMLKRELAEIRANQALSEDKVLASVTGSDRERTAARSVLGGLNTEAEMERSAHRETMDTLEKSEHTFLLILRAMAASLEVEELGGLRPMAHLPKDEREKLVIEREAACDFLSSRIQILKERVTRKDELLQGYENDLSKLRQSQQIAQKKAAQVDDLTKDIRSRAEESQYLRETLNRTRDKLNQEKRLNTAIKEKKTFHLENERAHLRPQSAGRSRPQTQEEKIAAAARKKVQKEMMKRKNYEIRTLKEELCDKEQTLYDREKRLSSLETSLGLERPVEVLE